MSWRTVVISSNAKLDYQMGYMVVRRMDTLKIHLSEMEILLIESTAVSLTAALLAELSKKKIKVILDRMIPVQRFVHRSHGKKM